MSSEVAAAENRDHPAAWDVACLNCGSHLQGPFCSMCGQRALPPHPTVSELVGDAFAEFSGWDGKFAETIRTLVRKPGELTRQWLQGRRVHFISPLRLYLTASLVYFVVQSSVPRLEKASSQAFQVDTRTNAGRASAAATKAVEHKPMTAAERDSALASAQKAPAIMRPFIRRLILEPDRFKASLRESIPRMLFALLPLYALILALFYRRRHYPEHLYFAIHLHAYVFLALMISELTKFTYSGIISATAGILTFCWIALYALAALRHVYGGSWPGTIAKGVAIMFLYSIIALPVMLGTMLLAAFL